MTGYKLLLDDEGLRELAAALDKCAALNSFSYSIDSKPFHCVNEVTVTLPAFALTGLRSAMFNLKKKGNR